MSYEGYLLKLNNRILDNSIIVPGSYEAVKERTVCGSWRDANGDMHYSFYPNKKTTISLNIKQRTQEQQQIISHFFTQLDNISVNYWNDTSQTYETGFFKMDDVKFKHQYDNEDRVFYAETQIVLKEY